MLHWFVARDWPTKQWQPWNTQPPPSPPPLASDNHNKEIHSVALIPTTRHTTNTTTTTSSNNAVVLPFDQAKLVPVPAINSTGTGTGTSTGPSGDDSDTIADTVAPVCAWRPKSKTVVPAPKKIENNGGLAETGWKLLVSGEEDKLPAWLQTLALVNGVLLPQGQVNPMPAVAMSGSVSSSSFLPAPDLVVSSPLPELAATNSRGETLLHGAAVYCNPTVVVLLLRYGASARATDHCGFTPLHLACSMAQQPDEQIEVVRLLLQYGADVNAVNIDVEINLNGVFLYVVGGRTPLYYCAEHGIDHLIPLLLAHGAKNAEMLDNDQLAPYQVALLHNHPATARLLNPNLSDAMMLTKAEIKEKQLALYRVHRARMSRKQQQEHDEAFIEEYYSTQPDLLFPVGKTIDDKKGAATDVVLRAAWQYFHEQQRKMSVLEWTQAVTVTRNTAPNVTQKIVQLGRQFQSTLWCCSRCKLDNQPVHSHCVKCDVRRCGAEKQLPVPPASPAGTSTGTGTGTGVDGLMVIAPDEIMAATAVEDKGAGGVAGADDPVPAKKRGSVVASMDGGIVSVLDPVQVEIDRQEAKKAAARAGR